MKTFIYLLPFVALSALAGDPSQITPPDTGILMRRVSGFVNPQDAYFEACSIAAGRVVYSHRSRRNDDGTWGVQIDMSSTLKKKDWKQIRKLLDQAASGNVTKSPLPCDVGSEILAGYINQKEITLQASRDCDARYDNTSPAVAALKKKAEKLCRIRLSEFRF